MNSILLIILFVFIGWGLFTAYYIYRLTAKGIDNINLYIYDSIPNVFTTIGVLGTFIGIFLGLKEFDVENITDSIPKLLEGLKYAFQTSIFGIVLSLISAKFCQFFLRHSEKKMPAKATGELAALQEINDNLLKSKQENKKSLEELNKSLVGDSDNSISTQIAILRNQFSDVQKSLGGDGDTSLLTQIQKLRAEQTESAKETGKNVKEIVATMNSNNEILSEKFDEFSEILAKNNTEALVEVMKSVTEEFNKQMSALIEKLVQENFQELNNSVQKMNDWQKENKEMIVSLTNQFTTVSEDFKIASGSIKEITQNTNKLTHENSHLTKLIKELQKVMIDDTKYQQIVHQLTSSIDTLKNNTDSFDKTTDKLNSWVQKQMNFTDSVAKLLTRLEEIDRIKDINKLFWKDTKKQLNEGVSIIEKANSRLANDVENINQEFYERLNETLQNLDTLIQRIIAENN